MIITAENYLAVSDVLHYQAVCPTVRELISDLVLLSRISSKFCDTIKAVKLPSVMEEDEEAPGAAKNRRYTFRRQEGRTPGAAETESLPSSGGDNLRNVSSPFSSSLLVNELTLA